MRGKNVVPLAWSLLCVVLAVASLGGCKDGDKKKVAAAAPVDTGEINKQEEDLMSRRDALLKSRQGIREQRDKVDEELRAKRAAGEDTSELDKKADELRSQETDLTREEDDLNAKFDSVLEQRRELMAAIAASGASGDATAAREASMAGREKSVAGREERLAAREATIAEREKAQALREKETCGVGTPQTIIQTIDVKGSKYTKKDVEPLLKRARSEMSKKGMLSGDLPSPAQGLEREATKAMADGDFGKARFAAAQLIATIDATKIDKSFIAAKIGRLSGAMKGVKLEDRKQGEVDKLFQEAQGNYGDGEFSSANKRLNKIYAVIQ
jgi:cytidylate kinase